MSTPTEQTAAGEQPASDTFRPGWCWMTHPSRNGGQPIPVLCSTDADGNWYEPLQPEGEGFQLRWEERSCSWRVVPAPEGSVASDDERVAFLLNATREAQAFAAKYADEVMELRAKIEQLQSRTSTENPQERATEAVPASPTALGHAMALLDMIEPSQLEAMAAMLAPHDAHTRLELLVWHAVPGPRLPDADATVLCQLEADDEDCWPGYWDGERWISAEGFPFASRVVAWSAPRGVKP
jgi:hypothetical protein